ncbi:MAG: efflux RND transporter periplasmic adaptor subunit [Armatimonadaceae bacterium]
MKRSGWIIGIVVVVILAVGFSLLRGRSTASAKVKVGRTVKVERGDIQVKVSESGVLEPVTQVEVKSQVAGRVLRILVKEGDRVEKGALIALVDPTDIERDFERIKAQLAASQAGLRQAQENYELAVRQNKLAIQRAENNLKEAQRRLSQVSAPTRPQEIQQAQASVDSAQAGVEQAQAAANQSAAQVGQAKANLQRVEAQIVDSERNLERQKALVDKGFVAQSAVDQAQTALQLAEADRVSAQANLQAAQASERSAQANLRSTRANLASARQRLDLLKEGPRVEDIAPARAAVETARTALETERANAAQAELRRRDIERAQAEVRQIENQLAQQQVRLRETRIVAPISGEIISKNVNEGELVASATAGFAQGAVLVRVADLSRMQVRVNVNEVDVARIRVGLPVEVRVDGAPGKVYSGEVQAIAPASLTANQGTQNTGNQNAVVRFEVKIRVENPDARLRPGMTAAVAIIRDEKKGVLILPAEALGTNDTVTVVTGTGEKQTKAEKKITVGLKNDATIEVVSGLSEGETIEVAKVDASDRRKIQIGGGDDGDEGEGEE